MSVQPEAIAIQALREYLLRTLPAKVASINATRAAVLKSALVGPFEVPEGATLTLALTLANADTGTGTLLTSGSRTAAQIAAELSVSGITASADTDGRLVLTRTVAPVEGTPSALVAKAADFLGIFGWDVGGERTSTEALTAPTRKGICDGWPVTAPDMGRSFWLIIGDREGTPIAPDNRRDETLVVADLTVWVPDRTGTGHRNRERVSAAVRCLRELLLTSEGRQLGRGAVGDVVFAAIRTVRIPAKPFSLDDARAPHTLFDAAILTLAIKVFEAPAS